MHSPLAWDPFNARYTCRKLLNISWHEMWSFKEQQIPCNSSNCLVPTASPVCTCSISRLPDNTLCNVQVAIFSAHCTPRRFNNHESTLNMRISTKRQTIIYYFSFGVIENVYICTDIGTHMYHEYTIKKAPRSVSLENVLYIAWNKHRGNLFTYTETHGSRWHGRCFLKLWTLYHGNYITRTGAWKLLCALDRRIGDKKYEIMIMSGNYSGLNSNCFDRKLTVKNK